MEKEINAQIDFNSLEHCIKAENDFTNVKYHNICTGETTIIPTGVADYILYVPIILLLGTVLFVIIKFLREDY